jgi:hypothetical protein
MLNCFCLGGYYRAGPISRALELGADIVITGRCTDSALALGPLVHSVCYFITCAAKKIISCHVG